MDVRGGEDLLDLRGFRTEEGAGEGQREERKKDKER